MQHETNVKRDDQNAVGKRSAENAPAAPRPIRYSRPGWSANSPSSALQRLKAASSHASRYVLQLQQQGGNRYVQRMLALARQAEGPEEVHPEVEAGIASARGGGQGLDSGARLQMESAFGADFSGVRVHTGREAHSLNQAVNAVAFTTGQDIFFREGAYEPGTSAGQELLAHELTHVVQQSGAAVQSKSTLSQPGDEFEVEAERVAKAVVSGGQVQRACASCTEAEEDKGGAAAADQQDSDDDIGGTVQTFPVSRMAAHQQIQRYLVGPPQRVDLSTTAGPTYGHCRNFNHVISWNTDLRDGYILQECMNADTITQCDGTNVPAPNTPHYWEAWYVDSTGAISDGNSDTWFRAGRPSTTGTWTFDSNVFAVGGSLKASWGFSRGAVGTAGSLLSTTTGPSQDELYQPSLTRHRGGQWDCCNGKDTHTPI